MVTEEHGEKLKPLLFQTPIPFYAPQVPLSLDLKWIPAFAGMTFIICFAYALIGTGPTEY